MAITRRSYQIVAISSRPKHHARTFDNVVQQYGQYLVAHSRTKSGGLRP